MNKDLKRTKQGFVLNRRTKQGFVKKNVGGCRYKPRGDWFSFAKVRKLCFLCSCKQTLVFARLTHACAAPASYVICRKQQNCLYRFKYGYFSYKNAWICYKRPLFTPQSRVMRVLIWMRALYLTTFKLLNKNTGPCHYKA